MNHLVKGFGYAKCLMALVVRLRINECVGKSQS